MPQTTSLEAPPVSPELLAKAQATVVEFRTSCFWFRDPEASIETAGDIRLIIRHLREYGGWKAWYKAQELRKCL